ncbi:unnamed protein product [Clonostachys solani]|uniref:Uncharacterized protein n=1 Tax=Clonostachys solani TaxID=160281 RepID=A0A9N9W8X7_9HYPO|nr:unnamed protein product [Clonostachys solani]
MPAALSCGWHFYFFFFFCFFFYYYFFFYFFYFFFFFFYSCVDINVDVIIETKAKFYVSAPRHLSLGPLLFGGSKNNFLAVANEQGTIKHCWPLHNCNIIPLRILHYGSILELQDSKFFPGRY